MQMRARLSPSVPGAHYAKDLLLKVEQVNARCKARSGDLDIRGSAHLLDAALRDPRLRAGLLLALAEFIGTAIDGSAIDIHSWVPLEHFDPQGRPMLDAKPPVKKRP